LVLDIWAFINILRMIIGNHSEKYGQAQFSGIIRNKIRKMVSFLIFVEKY